ncbi:Uncharacterised protein [Kluyvera cryocrescens]|uniref:Uncharacterized protein n=1 Tax=Kluyvera cryocrescens TaxID=580 RepID=A0A485CEM5_KLUCR|nr:Uncharacterised protein [Kluyvera cryocrescens]
MSCAHRAHAWSHSQPSSRPPLLADPRRSILDDARFASPAPVSHASHADDRFAAATVANVEGEISEQNVERVIRQVLERLGK